MSLEDIIIPSISYVFGCICNYSVSISNKRMDDNQFEILRDAFNEERLQKYCYLINNNLRACMQLKDLDHIPMNELKYLVGLKTDNMYITSVLNGYIFKILNGSVFVIEKKSVGNESLFDGLIMVETEKQHKRKRSIELELHLQLLSHASNCGKCSSKNCMKMKVSLVF